MSGALLLVFLAGPAFGSSVQKKAQARAEFRKAERLREELAAKPDAQRRPADYLAAIRLYDHVVHLGPTLSVADDSVAAAARLWAEMGRRFRDRQALERAREKYRFLFKHYPHSKFVGEAKQSLLSLENAGRQEETAEKAAPAPPDTSVAAPTPVAAPGRTPPAQGPAGQIPPGKLVLVTSIRHWATPSYTRVVIGLDGPVEYQAGRIANPDRIFFDLHGARLSPALRHQALAGDDGLLKRIRMAQNQIGIARIVLEVGPVRDYSAFLLPNPYRLVVDINGGPPRRETVAVQTPRAPSSGAPATQQPARPETAAATASKPSAGSPGKMHEPPPEKLDLGAVITSTTAPTSKPVFERVPQPAAPPQPKESAAKETPAKETAGKESSAAVPAPPRVAKPTSNGQRSLIRALGLKIGKIVIDPGHGGHDTGTIGPTGLMEKELVLDVATRLAALIENRLGGEVIYTREDDTFVPLETRTAIANQKQADLFVSIHANSSRDAGARGIETYYLNFTSAQDALEVAARENAVSEKSIHELQDLVKKITLKEKLEESREFAADVQRSLVTTMTRGNTGLRNRGVKKAPFVVLIGAKMPSILAEISFVSNPTDERLLRKPEYRQKVAEALYRGIQRYANSLAGVKIAASRLGRRISPALP